MSKKQYVDDVLFMLEGPVYLFLFAWVSVAGVMLIASCEAFLFPSRDVPVPKPPTQTHEKLEWDPLSPLAHQEGGLREYK